MLQAKSYVHTRELTLSDFDISVKSWYSATAASWQACWQNTVWAKYQIPPEGRVVSLVIKARRPQMQDVKYILLFIYIKNLFPIPRVGIKRFYIECWPCPDFLYFNKQFHGTHSLLFSTSCTPACSYIKNCGSFLHILDRERILALKYQKKFLFFHPCIADFVFCVLKTIKVSSKRNFFPWNRSMWTSKYPDSYADFRSEEKFKKKGTKERLFSRIVFQKTQVHRKKSETSIKFWTICTFFTRKCKLRNTKAEYNEKHFKYFSLRIPLPTQNCMNKFDFQ